MYLHVDVYNFTNITIAAMLELWRRAVKSNHIRVDEQNAFQASLAPWPVCSPLEKCDEEQCVAASEGFEPTIDSLGGHPPSSRRGQLMAHYTLRNIGSKAVFSRDGDQKEAPELAGASHISCDEAMASIITDRRTQIVAPTSEKTAALCAANDGVAKHVSECPRRWKRRPNGTAPGWHAQWRRRCH